MGLITRAAQFLTGGSKVADDVFDKDSGHLAKIGGFINDLHLSDAERMKANIDMAAKYSDFVGTSLTENSQRSKTRRTIAVKWITLQIHLIEYTLLGVLVDFTIQLLSAPQGKLLGDTGFRLTEAISSVTFSPYVWGITAGVSAFFFGTHLLRASQYSINAGNAPKG